MKKILLGAALAAMTMGATAATQTTLADYAYDFTEVGYNVKIIGDSDYYSPMNAKDYFRLESDGYTLETRIDGLSRKGRKEFVKHYNDNCRYNKDKCRLTVTGEMEMNESMKMVLTAKSIEFYLPTVKLFK